MDYKKMSTDELLTALTEVCAEVQSRAIGLADVGGKVEPIIEQEGNTFTAVHIDSSLGVNVVKAAFGTYKVNMFENGKKITDEIKNPFRMPDIRRILT